MTARARHAISGAVGAVALFAAIVALGDRLYDPLVSVVRDLTLIRAIFALAIIAAVASVGARYGLTGGDTLDRPLSPRWTTTLLAVVVGVSAGIWQVIGSGETLPRILGDELLYANLGKSVAHGDGLMLRGATETGYSLGYPVFLAPFYAVAHDAVAAYAAIQTVQAFVMASAAVPAYLLARRLMGARWAILCAVIAANLPQLVFSPLVMTEPVFYPLLLWFCVALVRALESPTIGAQALMLVLLAVTCAVRLQGVILLAAIVTAVVVHATPGNRQQQLRRWLPTLALLGVAVLVAGGVALATGRAPLGAYDALLVTPDVGGTVIWTARTFGGLAVAAGFVAAAVLLPAVARLLRGTSQERAVAAALGAVIVWTCLAVGHYSSTTYALDHVHERNFFSLTPLVVILGLAWATRGFDASPLVFSAGAVTLIACVAALRRGDVSHRYDIDGLSLVPWRDLGSGTMPASRLVLLAAIVAVAVAASTRRPWVIPLTALFAIGVAAIVPTAPATRAATKPLAWIDHTAGTGANALVLTVNLPDGRCERRGLEEIALWSEFFNTAATRAAHVYADNRANNLASPKVTIAPDGTLLQEGRPLTSRLVALDNRLDLVGSRLASISVNVLGGTWDEKSGLSLWRTAGSPRLASPSTLAGLASRTDCPVAS